MKASNGRLFYEIIFWGIVGTLVYFNRGLYQKTQNFLSPYFQAYTEVAVIVLGLALILTVFYLREAIASSVIALTRRASGGQPLDIEKGNPDANIRRTARRFERKGDYQAAGEAYESLEFWREAALVYERGNNFGRAANAWNQADNVGKAIEFYEKDGNFEAAGNLCMNEGLQDRASRNYRIAGDSCLEQNQFATAADFYEKARDFGKAASIFEQAHKPDRALSCYEKAGNTNKILDIIKGIHPSEYHRRGAEFTQLVQRSAELLFQNGLGAEAARILEDCQALTRAAEIYGTCRMWDKSAELYLTADQPELAEKAVANIEDKSVAAEISAKLAVGKGDWTNAGKLYAEAGKQGLAIDAFKKARDFDSAAQIYETMGRFIMAGEMYSSSRNFTAAANSYAKAYDWRNAAECFEESGDLAQAIEAYANAGNYLKAGALALKMTDYARAVEYLQRIPPGAPDYVVGTAFLATAFYYQAHYDMSFELFSRVMDTLPINRETLPAYYAYASNIEKDDPKHSLGLFRQILGVDVHYSDVSDRVQRLEKIVTSMSTGFGSRTPNPITSIPKKYPQSPSPPLPGTYNQNAPGINTSVATQPLTGSDSRMVQPTPFHTENPEIPAVLDGRYQVQELISRNGRVADHTAVDTVAEQKVFLRTFPRPDDPVAYKSTMDMLAGLSDLTNKSINSILAHGEEQGLIYIVSPFPSGQNLWQWIRAKGPASINEGLQILNQLLETLDFVHSHEICHLNLRPEVVTINPERDPKILLGGFGVPVRQPQSTEPVYLTMPDSDPQYLAPEQIIGTDVDSRTDIYAFGLLLFFVLTGRTPFDVKRVNDTQEIARMQVQVSLPRPSTIRATLPSSVDDIFLRCVNKSALSRYQSIAEVLEDVRVLQTNLTS